MSGRGGAATPSAADSTEELAGAVVPQAAIATAEEEGIVTSQVAVVAAGEVVNDRQCLDEVLL